MESEIDYVIRKLNDPVFNMTVIAVKTGVSRFQMNQLLHKNEAKLSTIYKLYDYFKKISD